MAGVFQFYKAFRLINARRKGYWTAQFLIKNANFHLPRKFKWSMDAGLPELKHYIDLLLAKRKVEASLFEEKGIAFDHEYEDEAVRKQPVINVSPELLLSVLLGELPLEVPIDAVLQMRGDKRGGRFVPGNLPAALADEGLLEAYYEGLREFMRTGRPWTISKPLKGIEDKKLPDGADSWSPCQTLIEAENQGTGEIAPGEPPRPGSDAPAVLPPREEPLLANELDGGHIEYISVIHPNNGSESYFLRRIMDGEKVLESYTSWYIDKDWTRVQPVEEAA